MFSYEFSRLFFHHCFSVKLRRRAAYPEASDGGYDNDRFPERSVSLEGYCWHSSDDDFVLSHAGIAAAIRSQLPLSIPGFERDLHHVAGSGRPEREAKRATRGWHVADQRRDSARFAELTTATASAEMCDAGLAELAPPKIHAPASSGQSLSRAAKLILRIFSGLGSASFG